MKKTLNDLEKQIAVLERDKETIKAKDELMRKEISEALGIFKSIYYDNSKEVRILSWFQIMKEIGILLTKDNFGELYRKIKLDIDYLIEENKRQNEKQNKNNH